MAARSKVTGRRVIWDEIRSLWVYPDTGKEATGVRPCSKCGHKPVGVRVKIPADLSHTGKEFWKVAQIDYCIAPIVKALQEGGIDMRGSCCGHGNAPINIMLSDKRILRITDD